MVYFHSSFLDRDAKNARSTREKSAKKPRLDRDIDKEEDKEIYLSSGDDLPPLALIWNANCGTLPKVLKSNANRNRKSKNLAKQGSDEYWSRVVERIAKSAFCGGKNKSGWKATFDWLLQSDTHLKVMEGKYDDSAGPSPDIDWKKVYGGKNAAS
jgi:hypothetical protein